MLKIELEFDIMIDILLLLEKLNLHDKLHVLRMVEWYLTYIPDKAARESLMEVKKDENK